MNNQIMQISLLDLQQAFLTLGLAIAPIFCFIGFLLGYVCHDTISYYFEVFFRWLRRRKYRNKVRAYHGY